MLLLREAIETEEREGGAMSEKLIALPFKRAIRRCPKCGGRQRRTWCNRIFGECCEFASPIKDIEHFDVICQECRYVSYERVKP